MATPEGRVKDYVKARLRQAGGYFAMPVGGMYGQNGIPDFLICLRGTFYGIETKATRKQHPTTLQCIQLQKIEASGGIALVVDADNMVEAMDVVVGQVWADGVAVHPWPPSALRWRDKVCA